MAEHPICDIMDTSLENTKEMIDVNTIVGDPVQTPDGSVIIPISKVKFGFAAGGAEFLPRKKEEAKEDKVLFGGGTGAGVSINPVAFLVVGQNQIKLLPVTNANNTVADKIIDYIPTLFDKVNELVSKRRAKKEKEREEDYL